MSLAIRLGFVVVGAALVGGSDLLACILIVAGVTYMLLGGGPYYRRCPRRTAPRGSAATADAP